MEGMVLLRKLSLKRRADVCVTYIYPFILYRLSVLTLPIANRDDLVEVLFLILWVYKSH